MDTTSCFSCNAFLPARGVFCPKCGVQIRCKSCRELLEPEALVCVECGTSLSDSVSKQPPVGGINSSSAVNLIRYEETRTSRSLEARFTDASVDSLSIPLGAVMAGRLDTSKIVGRRGGSIPLNDAGHGQLPLPDELDGVIEVEAPGAVAIPAISPPMDGTDKERLARLFVADGDRLRLKDVRIKADNKIDFVGRLTCLLLYALECQDRPNVPRSALNAVLTEAGVYDANARKWISNTTDLLLQGDTMRLSVPGQERAVATLNRIFDASIASTWTLHPSSRSRSNKSNGATDGAADGGGKPSRRKGSGESKNVETWVARWKALGMKVSPHAILTGKTVAEKGLFGLWAIRRATGDSQKIVSRVLLSRFILEAFEFKINDRSLQKALNESEVARGKAINIEGTKFQINESGIEFIENMAGLRTETMSAPSSSVGIPASS